MLDSCISFVYSTEHDRRGLCEGSATPVVVTGDAHELAALLQVYFFFGAFISFLFSPSFSVVFFFLVTTQSWMDGVFM